MKSQAAQLTQRITGMNGAPEDKKVGLMAAVVTSMVEQRVTMNARKIMMEEVMMQRMQMGKESMSQCPMMQGMKGIDDNSGNAQKVVK